MCRRSWGRRRRDWYPVSGTRRRRRTDPVWAGTLWFRAWADSAGPRAPSSTRRRMTCRIPGWTRRSCPECWPLRPGGRPRRWPAWEHGKNSACWRNHCRTVRNQKKNKQMLLNVDLSDWWDVMKSAAPLHIVRAGGNRSYYCWTKRKQEKKEKIRKLFLLDEEVLGGIVG